MLWTQCDSTPGKAGALGQAGVSPSILRCSRWKAAGYRTGKRIWGRGRGPQEDAQLRGPRAERVHRLVRGTTGLGENDSFAGRSLEASGGGVEGRGARGR